MNTATSRDGTSIAFERLGSGPAVILVDGALCSRAFGPSAKLAARLAPHFTVFRYDRRGRGESGETLPYAPSREVEDIAALVQAAGGKASLVGLSSGGALALEAAAAGLPIEHVVAYEPPYVANGHKDAGHAGHLKRLVARGHRGAAVRYFMREMVGAPGFVVVLMQLMPWVWRKLKGVAHTLPYDAAVMDGFQVPRTRFASIDTRVLVLNGTKTDPRLRGAARTVAEVIPRAEHRELEGQTHNVGPAPLAAAVFRFLEGAGTEAPRRG